MAKLNLTDHLLKDLITQVAPLVTQVTGWELDLPGLQSRVLPKDQGYEAILLGRFHQLGIPEYSELVPDLIERVLEYVVEANTLAAYLPGSGEILVIAENVDDGNLDGLKIILAHELTHRAQHVTHAGLYERIDALIQHLFDEIRLQPTNVERIQHYSDQIQPLMTLLESHAAYVQNLIQQKYFPNAQIERPFSLATLLMRLLGTPKLDQYSDGQDLVKQAWETGEIDVLFRSLQ